MANNIILHPSGADTNGGGYTSNYTGTWAEWHNNFSYQATYAGGTITQGNNGKCRITCGTNLSVYPKQGMLVYLEAQTYYASGHYEVTADIEDGDYFDINLDYVSNDSVSNITIGGALKTPSVAALLAYDSSGSKLLLPANQTTQTINEVDGSANQVLLVTQGYTIDIQGVNDTTGQLLSDDDLFPKIKAKTGSTWGANTVMFYMQSGVGDDTVQTTQCKIDKVNFDGNNITPYVVRIGDYSNDYIICTWGTVEIINSIPNSASYYCLYVNAYTYADINTAGRFKKIYIANGGVGFATVRPFSPIMEQIHIDNCYYGLSVSNAYITTFTNVYINRMIISNCAVGIFTNRYSQFLCGRFIFVNNTIDMIMNKYSTTMFAKYIHNCLFYNDKSNGKIVSVDDSNYVTVAFDNCVLGVSNGAVIDSGVTSTKTNCTYITSDVFMDKANGDYRLNPNAVEFSKVYNWATGEFYGALGPAFPVNNGNGDSYITYEDSALKFYVNGELIRSYT